MCTSNQNAATARASFEKSVGKPIQHATESDIENWSRVLKAEGKAVNTIRTYISLVRQMVHVAQNKPLPKREPTKKRILSEDEIRRLLGAASENDHAWIAAMFVCGPDVLGWRFQDLYSYIRLVPMTLYDLVVADAARRGFRLTPLPYRGRLDAHWVNGWHDGELIWKVDQHRFNRQLKSAARKAGIGAWNMNVTTIRYAHERLTARYHDAEGIALALGIAPRKPIQSARVPQLHGVGRRSFSIKTA